jgi:hypothetical protein
MRHSFALTLLLTLSLSPGLWSQDIEEDSLDTRKQSIFDVMYAVKGDMVRIDLELDIDLLERNRLSDKYQSGVITFEDARGRTQRWDVEIRSRGRYRRRTCDFPPIKLKFDKAELRARNFKKHNELKLVTHCLESKEGRENVAREYLAYKLYAALSPIHYRVKMARMRYIDTRTGKKRVRYGIMLEDEDELATRYGLKMCEDCFAQPPESFDQHNMYTVALFESMIANADWSITMLRNVKLLHTKGKKEPRTNYLVPFDFDFSGLVNASYAIPDPTLKLRSLRERRLQGPLDSKEQLEDAFRYLKERKEVLVEIIDKFEHLSRSSRLELRDFVLTFYNDMAKGHIARSEAATF